MTDKDKTREKLVDSMRKTRSGSKAAGNKTVKKKSKKKSSSTGKKTAAPGGAKKGAVRQVNIPAPDPYQAARRVWPD